jgi:hypothetical protein
LVEDDRYFLTMSYYIHGNPIQAPSPLRMPIQGLTSCFTTLPSISFSQNLVPAHS